MLADGPILDVQHLPPQITAPIMRHRDPDMLSLKEVERIHVDRVLASVNGNKQKAASILGIARATLYSILADDSESATLDLPGSRSSNTPSRIH